MTTGLNALTQHKQQLSRALECSIYVRPEAPGLTTAEIQSLSAVLGWKPGYLHQAREQLEGANMIERQGTRLMLAPHNHLTEISLVLQRLEPEYRNGEALDAVLDVFHSKWDAFGTNATATKDEVIEGGTARGISRYDMLVAFECLRLASVLRAVRSNEQTFSVSPSMSRPSELIRKGPLTERPEIVSMYEHVKAIIGKSGTVVTELAPAQSTPAGRTAATAGSPVAREEMQTNRKTETRLFISHSSKDVDLADLLVRLIDAALQVPTGWIRCTSVPGYGLDPGDPTPQVLRQNLHDAAVVIGLLTPNSAQSEYVLMELGAAWAFQNRIIPLLAGGVEFSGIPGPIGNGIHAVKTADDKGMAKLVDIISKDCVMPWRAEADRRQALFTDFARVAVSSVKPATTDVRPIVVPAAVLPSSVPAPVPADMSEGDRIGRIRIWLHDHKDTEDQRCQGRPFSLSEIDREAGIPDGSAEKFISIALDRSWRVIRRDGSFIELLYAPVVATVGIPIGDDD